MKLYFNKNFYNSEGIKSSISAFEDEKLAEFEMVEKDEEFEVKIKNIKDEVKDILEDEFYNYVLVESRRRMRG